MLNLIAKKVRIKQKLILINLLTTGIALLLAGSALLLQVFFSFRESMLNNLTTQADILAKDNSAPLIFGDHKTAAEDLRILKASPNILYAIIYGKDGNVFAEYRRDGAKRETPPLAPQIAGHRFSINHLDLYQRILLDRDTIGWIYLRSDMNELHSLMLKYAIISVTTIVVVFAFAYLMLTRLQRVITVPILKLAETMQKVSSDKDYTHKANINSEDEIGFLANGFNEMLEQIRERDVQLRTEIVERKRAAKELKNANSRGERLLRFSEALLSAIPTPVFYKDLEGRYLGCNQAFSEVTGVSADQIAGKTVMELWPGERAEVYHRKDLELLANPARQTYDFEIRDKDGKTRTVIFIKDVFLDENREIAGIVGAFLDISERKEAEERLRQAKEEWERTFDAIVDPVMITDSEHRIIKANKAMADKLGITTADAEGLACFNALHGAAGPPLFCPHSELLADGQPHSIEIYEERLGGYFIVSVSPLFTPQGEVYGSVHYARDITERKQAEESLKESETRFKTIFDNNTDGLIVADIESKKFVQVNAKVCLMLGYDENEISRMGVMDIPPVEDIPYVVEQFEKQARGEITVAEKIPVKRKDGTVFYADVNSSPLTLDGKEYLLGALRDVTEREQSKDALLDSEQKLKAIIYGSPIPQFVIDQDHKVLYWNNALAELTGIKAEVMIGSNEQWRAFYPEERPCLADLLLDGATGKIREVYRGKYNRSSLVANAYEAMDFFPALGKGGKWLHFTAAGIKDAKDRVIGVVETLEDITERKLAEESVRRLNDELEQKVEQRSCQLLEAQEELLRKEKLAILGQLSGSVGHELRNPLGVMSNAVYYLKMVNVDADETTREYLDIIDHEINLSQRIITDLLDFARTKTPHKMSVMVRVLIEETLKRCPLPENVEIICDIPDSLPPLNVDPLQIGQVYQNIITNGIQAMPNGGVMRISARFVQGSGFGIQDSEKDKEPGTLNIRPDGDFIEIRIVDSGEGILPENMKKLFQPLYTTKTKGIGLGLTVCRNLTEANGGRILLDSEPGKGTTITMIFPVGG